MARPPKENDFGVKFAQCRHPISAQPMKFVERSHFTDPGAAVCKVVEVANATETLQDGRIYIEPVNGRFLNEGGTPGQFRAGLAQARVRVHRPWARLSLVAQVSDLCPSDLR